MRNGAVTSGNPFSSPPPSYSPLCLQAEKDKILKLSAEILRLEKAVQEERSQTHVFKSELAREKDSSLVRHPATRAPLYVLLMLFIPLSGVASEVPGANFYVG